MGFVSDEKRERRLGMPVDNLRMHQLYETHAGPLFRFLVQVTLRDRLLAEDLFQETMLRAWRNIDTVPTEADSVRRWLFTVGRRVAIDAARGRRTRPQETELTDAVAARLVSDDQTEAVMAAEAVRRALPGLSDDHREILVELYLRDGTIEDVAKRLGIPKGTVKSRAYYALKSLRTAFDNADPHSENRPATQDS